MSADELLNEVIEFAALVELNVCTEAVVHVLNVVSGVSIVVKDELNELKAVEVTSVTVELEDSAPEVIIGVAVFELSVGTDDMTAEFVIALMSLEREVIVAVIVD